MRTFGENIQNADDDSNKSGSTKNLDNVGAVLVYPSKITTSGLIQSALSNDLVVNCIVDEDPDNAFVGKSL